MADSLATINVDHLSQSVNKALSRLARNTGIPPIVQKIRTPAKASALPITKGPVKIAPAKKEHVFIKPSTAGPRKRHITPSVSGQSSMPIVPSTFAQAVSTNMITVPNMVRTKARSGSKLISRTPSVLPQVIPDQSVQASTLGINTQTQPIPSATVMVTVPQLPVTSTMPVAAQPAALQPVSTWSEPVLHTPPSTSASISDKPSEGVVFQVQMPVVQSLPPGTQVVNSFIPQSNSNTAMLTTPLNVTVDGKTVKLIPMPSVNRQITGTNAVSGQPLVVVHAPNHVTSEQSTQVVTSLPQSPSVGLSMATETVTMSVTPKSHVTSSPGADVPDLLAAATQATVPHLVTKYPVRPTQPLPSFAPPLPDKSLTPKQTKILKVTRESTQLGSDSTGEHVVTCMENTVDSAATTVVIQTANTITPSSAVQTNSSTQKHGTVKRKTVYAILLNQDDTMPGTKSHIENLVNEMEEFNSDSQTKTPEISSSFKGHFCADCNRVNADKCDSHQIHAHHITDTPILSRARASLPKGLQIKHQGTGMIQAVEGIKKHTRYGPLIGVKKEDSVITQTPYLWKLASQTEWLDCSDENQSNWMRYVRQATVSAEQNLVAYLEEDNIYFITSVNIEPDTELRYWFSEDYAKHIGKSCHPGGGFTCIPCLKIFDSLHALNQHYRYSHADTSKRKFPCSLCQRAFTSSSKRNTHMLSHTGQKPHRCQYCDKAFSDQSNLRMHLLIHSNLRKFECVVCKRSFKQKAHLTSHMLTHTGEKNMECEHCGKMFARRSDLRQHELQHTKDCIYKCDQPDCDKSFYKLQNLKKHQKIHAGVRDFICPTCQKSFASGYHLKRHVKDNQKCLSRRLGDSLQEAPS